MITAGLSDLFFNHSHPKADAVDDKHGAMDAKAYDPTVHITERAHAVREDAVQFVSDFHGIIRWSVALSEPQRFTGLQDLASALSGDYLGRL